MLYLFATYILSFIFNPPPPPKKIDCPLMARLSATAMQCQRNCPDPVYFRCWCWESISTLIKLIKLGEIEYQYRVWQENPFQIYLFYLSVSNKKKVMHFSWMCNLYYFCMVHKCISARQGEERRGESFLKMPRTCIPSNDQY